MATSKRSGLGGFNNQTSVGVVREGEPEGANLSELQGNLREGKAPRGDEADEQRDARRVGSARVGDEEDLDQGLDRLPNGDLDDNDQQIDPALDADTGGGE